MVIGSDKDSRNPTRSTVGIEDTTLKSKGVIFTSSTKVPKKYTMV